VASLAPQWEDDVPHGQGVYGDGVNTYSGGWTYGVRHGRGRHEVVGGTVYDGDWSDGVQHGCEDAPTSPPGATACARVGAHAALAHSR
jgi:hypothetical protein